MTGAFVAREMLLKCPRCDRVFESEALRRLVPHRCNIAWDVRVHIGLRMFLQHCSAEQIHTELLARDVRLSSSEISYLGRKFIVYLAIAHRQATPRINRSMQMAGGYVLHLDAAHDADAPALMTGMDSLSRFVLGNVKIPSEHANHIVPFLKQLRHDYGLPIATVHDMGTGICKAVTEVFPGVRDFICHFHFLRDVGKDLLDPSYSTLRNRLRKHSASTKLSALARDAKHRLSDQHISTQWLPECIKTGESTIDLDFLPMVSVYSLALWCLHGKHSGDGYGFPFDRPLLGFAERLLVLLKRFPELFHRMPAGNQAAQRIFLKFVNTAVDIVIDPVFEQSVEELRWRCRLFDDLRDKMRIAAPGGRNGLNDDGTATNMTSIRQGVLQFRRRLDQEPNLAADRLCRKMAEQIDRYGDKLFADPIELTTASGSMTLYPQRTNNIMEQFFRSIRRGYRHKTGNNTMRRMLQSMLADTPLVKNLENPEYMEILLDGKENLEELFAEMETNMRTSIVESEADADLILPGFRPLLKLQDLPYQISSLCTKAQAMAKSN